MFWNMSESAYQRCVHILHAFLELPADERGMYVRAVLVEDHETNELSFVIGDYSPEAPFGRLELNNTIRFSWRDVLNFVPDVLQRPSSEWLKPLVMEVRRHQVIRFSKQEQWTKTFEKNMAQVG